MLVVKCREHFDNVREWARDNGLLERLDSELVYLGEQIGYERQNEKDKYVELYKDFAPHSFTFCVFEMEGNVSQGEPKRGPFKFNGGLIYDGPESPNDGSAPALTVSLSRREGPHWAVHT